MCGDKIRVSHGIEGCQPFELLPNKPLDLLYIEYLFQVRFKTACISFHIRRFYYIVTRKSLSEIRIAAALSSLRILIGLKRNLGPMTHKATGQKYPFTGTDMPAESGSISPELVP